MGQWKMERRRREQEGEGGCESAKRERIFRLWESRGSKD